MFGKLGFVLFLFGKYYIVGKVFFVVSFSVLYGMDILVILFFLI